jgi:hypothetical protein
MYILCEVVFTRGVVCSPRVLQSTEGKNHSLPRSIYYFLHDLYIMSNFTPWLYGVNRVFFPLGQKTIINSTFYDTYLFQINLFFFTRGAVCSPRGSYKAPTVTIMQSGHILKIHPVYHIL